MHLVVSCLNSSKGELFADIGCGSGYSESRLFFDVIDRYPLRFMRERDFRANKVDMESHVILEEMRKLLPDMRRQAGLGSCTDYEDTYRF